MIFTSRRELLFVRVLAVLSFVAYATSQCYLLITEEHQRIVPYYPNPYFLAIFFILQLCVQASWLKGLLGEKSIRDEDRLLSSTDEDDITSKDENEEEEEEDITSRIDPSEMLYSLFYVISNLCMSAWSYLWLNEAYVSSLTIMIVNATIQLSAVFLLVLSPARNHPAPLAKTMTHLAAKTGAGISIMYVWKNCAVLDNLLVPATSEKIHSGVIYLLLTIASGPEPTFGLCLLFNFVALSLGNGQSKEWRHAFWFIAGTLAMAVFCDFVSGRILPSQRYQASSAIEGFIDDDLAEESSCLSPDHYA